MGSSVHFSQGPKKFATGFHYSLAKEQSFHQGVLPILNQFWGNLSYTDTPPSCWAPQLQEEICLSCGQLLPFLSGGPGGTTGMGPVLKAWGSKCQKKCVLNDN